MTTYTREETAAWTQADWDQLVGKRITLSPSISTTGVVAAATLRPGPYGPDAVVVVDWAEEDHGSWTFVREFGAWIEVES